MSQVCESCSCSSITLSVLHTVQILRHHRTTARTDTADQIVRALTSLICSLEFSFLPPCCFDNISTLKMELKPLTETSKESLKFPLI